MNKLIILLAAVLSVAATRQAAAQNGQAADKYMPFNHIDGDNMQYCEIDYSVLSGNQYGRMDDGSYMAVMPFIVEKPIPAGELFMLALYIPDGSRFANWGICTSEFEPILSYEMVYRDKNGYHVLLSQDDLAVQITPGTYCLVLQFAEEPTSQDVCFVVGYSTRRWYDAYVEHLAGIERKLLDSQPDYNRQDNRQNNLTDEEILFYMGL
jgi:hypothetical protein